MRRVNSHRLAVASLLESQQASEFFPLFCAEAMFGTPLSLNICYMLGFRACHVNQAPRVCTRAVKLLHIGREAVWAPWRTSAS